MYITGEQHGYNIPSVERCPQLPTWLENESYEEIRRRHDDRELPEQMRRLLCDAYICMYTSTSLAEYRWVWLVVFYVYNIVYYLCLKPYVMGSVKS